MTKYRILREVPWHAVWDIVDESDISSLMPASYPEWFELLPSQEGRRYPTEKFFSYSYSGTVLEVSVTQNYGALLAMWLYFKSQIQVEAYTNFKKKLIELEWKYGIPPVTETSFYVLNDTIYAYSLTTGIFKHIKYETWYLVHKDATAGEISTLETLITAYKDTLNDIYFNT